jgi:hypothetical protein
MNKLLELYTALNQCPEFKKAMGPWQDGDRYINPDYSSKVYVYCVICEESCDPHEDNAIRIPLTIDDSSEEASKRSLIGMLDVPPIITPIYNQLEDGNPIICWELDWINGNYTESTGGETITEAILRALLAQWGEGG